MSKFPSFVCTFMLSCLGIFVSCTQSNNPKSNNLTGQLASDCQKGNQNVTTYQPLYDSCFELIKTIKMTSAAQGQDAINQARPLVDELLPFFLSFEKHKQLTGELEKLSSYLDSGLIPEAEAQKTYDSLIVAWRNAADQLPGGAATYQKTKTSFLEAYPNPIK